MPTLTPQQAAKWLQGFTARLKLELVTAESQNLKAAYQTAQDYSTGTLSTATIAAGGHYYGRAFMGPIPQDPAIINRQTGGFANAWVMQEPASDIGNGELVTRLINASSQAAWLEDGTKFMIARHFAEAIEAANAPNRQQEIEAAVQRSLPK